MTATRGLSATLFGLALVSFMLPWLTVSCGGQRVVTVTGYELITGTTVEGKKDLESQPWAVLSLGLAGIGLVAVLVKSKPVVSARVAALVGSLAAASVVLTRWQLDRLIQGETNHHGERSPVAVEDAPGFWLAVGALATVIMVNLLAIGRVPKPTQAAVPSAEESGPSG